MATFTELETDAADEADLSNDGQLEDALESLGIGDEAVSPKAQQLRQIRQQVAGPIPGGGLLLEASDAKVFKTVHKTVTRHERLAKNRDEAGKHWDRVRSGCQFSVLEKSEDRAVYRAALPPGIDETPQPIPNKVDDLCHKIVSQTLVDPFLPNPKADGDSDRTRAAAELTKKFLRSHAAPSANDLQGLMREALNLNITRKSAFSFQWVDDTFAGWRPKQIKAHPQAEDPENPFVGPDGLPTADTVLRYVAEVEEEDEFGQPVTKLRFTRNPAEAARQWLPGIRDMLLHPNQVRTVPKSSPVDKAEQVILLMAEPLAEARRRFKVLDAMTTAQLQELCRWRPKRWQAIVPPAIRPRGEDDEGTVSEDTLLFWYHAFCAVSPSYPDGAEVAVNGAKDGTVLVRDTLRDDVELEDDTTVPVIRDIPVTQWKAGDDTVGGDPWGFEPIARFGGANEIYAHFYVAMLDGLDRGLNPNMFLPSTSPLTREDINRRDGTPLEIMVPEDKPTYEDTPELPSWMPQVLDRIEAGMNSAAGTNETSNGLDSPHAVSGEAKKVSIRQAKVALAQYWQNTAKAFSRHCKITVQLAQGRLTVPQQMRLAGQGSSHKQRWWVGADLVGVNEVAVEPGSGTMMSPPEKAQHIGFLQQSQWLDPEQAGELVRASMSDDLGLPPNVHEDRIDNEIGTWMDGPPSGWEEAYQANQQATQAHEATIQQTAAGLAAIQIDPAAAEQDARTRLPAPQLQPLFNPFSVRPNDEEPLIAKTQHAKLTRLMATPEYSKQPVSWRTLVDEKYGRAKYAAGITTLREQFEAQQQATAAQAAQAQQAEAQQQGAKVAEKSRDQSFTAQQSEASDARRLQSELALTAAEQNAQPKADVAAQRAPGALLPA